MRLHPDFNTRTPREVRLFDIGNRFNGVITIHAPCIGATYRSELTYASFISIHASSEAKALLSGLFHSFRNLVDLCLSQLSLHAVAVGGDIVQLLLRDGMLAQQFAYSFPSQHIPRLLPALSYFNITHPREVRLSACNHRAVVRVSIHAS